MTQRPEAPEPEAGDPPGPSGAGTPAIEVGVVLAGPWAPRNRQLAREAVDAVRARLAVLLPAFEWRASIVEHADESLGGRAEPVLLLDEAVLERNSRGWDFAFVLTEKDLLGYACPYPLAATSRLFSTAIVSLAGVMAGGAGQPVPTPRLTALLMHLFGSLNDLDRKEGHGFMRRFEEASELDAMEGFDADELELLRQRLAEVADPRIEERAGGGRGTLRFYAHALWENRRFLPRAVLRMRPWSFPIRLSRMTTAAGSALVVLMMTAETWEVAHSLSPGSIAVLALFMLLVTSAYVVRSQGLLARPGARKLQEQRAVGNLGTVVAVGAGMAVTYVAISVVALTAAFLLFRDPLLANWVEDTSYAAVRLHMASLTAAISLGIGALGASFEPRGYFRHVTHIDEEL